MCLLDFYDIDVYWNYEWQAMFLYSKENETHWFNSQIECIAYFNTKIKVIVSIFSSKL